MATPQTSRGFTLIELMVTVAIVAILTAIAYPAYHQYVLKGRRAEGRAALTAVLQQQERYYTQFGKYYISTSDSDNGPFKAYSGDNLGSSAYTLTSSLCADNLTAAECVQITATPTHHDDPEAGNLSINSVGPTRTCSGTNKSICWK
ncbi:type IV pilin protein [Aquabacterium sp.]|uniref:type IV pilin protein n=1 Tax=Aquabacterium sp. TaxID=1872578 RepID=UPI0035AE38F5